MEFYGICLESRIKTNRSCTRNEVCNEIATADAKIQNTRKQYPIRSGSSGQAPKISNVSISFSICEHIELSP